MEHLKDGFKARFIKRCESIRDLEYYLIILPPFRAEYINRVGRFHDNRWVVGHCKTDDQLIQRYYAVPADDDGLRDWKTIKESTFLLWYPENSGGEYFYAYEIFYADGPPTPEEDLWL